MRWLSIAPSGALQAISMGYDSGFRLEASKSRNCGYGAFIVRGASHIRSYTERLTTTRDFHRFMGDHMTCRSRLSIILTLTISLTAEFLTMSLSVHAAESELRAQ